MSEESQSIAKGKMPNKEPSMLVRIMLVLLPILIASGIGLNVFQVRQLQSLSERVKSQEDWRKEHTERVPEYMKQIASERDTAIRQAQTDTLREVESKAALQRENVLAQLATMQRDVIRIGVFLELDRSKGAAVLRQNLEPSK